MSGWIKVHRDIFDNPIVTKDAEHLTVWLWLLCNAEYEPKSALFGTERITINRGQVLTTVKEIAQSTGVNASKINRITELLESEKQIEKQTTSRNTLITIVNWDKYQYSEKQIDKEVKNNRKTSEKPTYIKRNKELKEEEEERRWLSDYLTASEWEKLGRLFTNLYALIDLVDDRVNRPEEIDNPFQYIIATAQSHGWERKKH